MPQGEKQLLTEIRDLQITITRKQECFQEEISELNAKVDKLLRFINPSQGEENDTENAETLMEYFEQHYGHLRDIGRSYLQDECHRLKRTKLRMWRNLLNKRKIAYYNAIKSRGTAEVYKEFFEKSEMFIPKKFREKITPQDTETQKRIKQDLSAAKFNSQIQILEDKIVHYTTMYLEIDGELLSEITNLCPEDTHEVLQDLWYQNTKSEEEKSQQIWKKKETWLRNLPNQEKENDRKKEIERRKKSERNNKQNQNERLNSGAEQSSNPRVGARGNGEIEKPTPFHYDNTRSGRRGGYQDNQRTRNRGEHYDNTRSGRKGGYKDNQRTRNRGEQSQNISYAQVVAKNYEEDFPRFNNRANNRNLQEPRRERRVNNRDETLLIGQRFRNRPFRRQNRNSFVYNDQYFLEEETGLKVPP